MSKVRFITARQAADLIEDRSNLCVNGFLMTNAAEELFKAVESRFLETGHPKDIKLMFTGSVGDGSERGINHFAHEGLIRECFGAHYGVMRKLSPLIIGNKIKAYNLPQGITVQLYRAMGSRQPGIISHVGLGTFADPDLDGGRLNAVSDEEYVRKIEIDGKPYLFYKTPDRIDYAMVRGTEADEDGNISMRKEALRGDSIPIAIAAKNTGGKVIVQVSRIVRRGSIDPKAVLLPRNLVDYVVVEQDPANHMHTQTTLYNEEFYRADGARTAVQEPPLPLSAKKVAARRSAMLLDRDDYILNFGVGVSDMVSTILKEEGVTEGFLQTAESGIIGGISQSGGDFGVAKNPEALVDVANQFDFYQGGGIDAAFLGLAQCDKEGNINVSKFGNTLVTGSGGFGDIAQNAKKVVFCGTFMVKPGKYRIENGKLEILEEGKGAKFLDRVEQITYSGRYARSCGQKAYAVTERCVLRLDQDGWTLIETAPGIDLERDILAHMDFMPMVSADMTQMPSCLFREEKMGLKISE